MTIPNECWDCVDNIEDMKAPEKSVLTFLCRKANPKENYSSWYSVSEMARILCMSESSIKRATSFLNKRGLIFKQRRTDTSSVYVVNLSQIVNQGVDNKNGKGQTDPTLRSERPHPQVTVTYKDVNENVNEDDITGGFPTEKPINGNGDPNIDLFCLNAHQAVKDFIHKRHCKLIFEQPESLEAEAYKWADDFFALNGSSRAFEFLCHFAEKELGPPTRLLNPVVRLLNAYESILLSKGDMEADNRFQYGWENYI